MANLNHLGQQFMPITQMQKLHSVDFDASDVGREGQGPATLGEVFNHVYTDRSSQSENGYHWDRLRKEVGSQGIKRPIAVANRGLGDDAVGGAAYQKPTMADGHHRAMMAIEQGHMFVPVEHHDTTHDYWQSPHTINRQDEQRRGPDPYPYDPDIEHPEPAVKKKARKRAPKVLSGQERLF